MTSIYIHIPFCAAKCNYCAFNSKVSGDDERAAYVDALTTEIKNCAAPEKISTIYFGGGTPTILNLAQLEKIFHAVEGSFFVEDDAEITVEANPGTVDENFLRGLKKIGFNRLSLGVQSFNDELLKILGRIHDSRGALETIHFAKNFFDNVSIDLMYGLPNQTLEDVRRAVKISAAQKIQHISIYGLEIEPKTNFGRLHAEKKLNLPDEISCEKMYDHITKNLPKLGYRRYEISNFARDGFESRHNLGYWTGAKYFGFGAGAHGYDGKFRASNIADVATYIKKIRAGENVSSVEEIITRSAAIEEFCFLGLRTAEGLNAQKFFNKFGENILDVYGKVIDKNIKLGLLENSGGRIFLTERGMKFGNVVFADFLL